MDFLVPVLVIIAIGFLALKLLFKKKKLSPVELKIALQALDPAQSLAPEHSILELHKIFVHKLNHLQGKNLKAAEITTLFAKRFPNEKDVWYFHRLRNRVAHQPNCKVSKKEAEQAYQTYKRALESLTK